MGQCTHSSKKHTWKPPCCVPVGCPSPSSPACSNVYTHTAPSSVLFVDGEVWGSSCFLVLQSTLKDWNNLGAEGTKKPNLHLNGNSGLPIRALRSGVGRGLPGSSFLVPGLLHCIRSLIGLQKAGVNNKGSFLLLMASSACPVSASPSSIFAQCFIFGFLLKFFVLGDLVFLCRTGGFLLMLVIQMSLL